jgi:phosphomannomutase
VTTQVVLSALSTGRNVGFGTSGVRALVSALDAELCYAYVMAFLNVVGRPRAVVLCHDLRPSSPAIARYCAAALRDAGVPIRFGGALPTPAAAAFAMAEACPAIVVTGSHIPFDRNGIKFYRAEGEITKDDERAMLSTEVDLPACVDAAALPCVDVQIERAYADRYLSYFPRALLSGMRLGVYQHSGVARDLLVKLLQDLGAEVVAFGRTDGFVPIDTEALTPDDRENARQWVRVHHLDGILSTDGDADRPLLADEAGEWFRGDLLGVICARQLGMQTVVTPVNSNTVVERCQWFDQVVRTRIGSPYVLAAIADAQASGAPHICGYEANGGFIQATPLQGAESVLSPLPTRDAVLPMLAALAMASAQGGSLAALRRHVPARFTSSDRVAGLAEGAAQQLVATLSADPAQRQRLMAPLDGHLTTMDLTDGLRMTLTNGDIVHLRASGNAPELRCYAESDEEGKAATWVERCLKAASAALN